MDGGEQEKMKFVFLLSFLNFLLVKAETNYKFSDDFFFGFATSSYQVEGAWNEDGKGENVWDRLTHTKPHKVFDGSNGDIACDSYHKYKEDVQMLKNLGAQVYRFSLSWSRILPKGDLSEINPAGVQYYNNLIDELLKNKIEPMVTLFHWDLPQPLQNLGGWVNPILIDYFEDFARLAFKTFGDRVKWWITFNEPLETCHRAYGGDAEAPCLGMSGVADYLCSHSVIKSHARAYHVYKDEFEATQGGKVGLAVSGGWNEPLTDSEEDRQAAENNMQFELGWFLHPILGPGGDYPPIMRHRVDLNSKLENRARSRLPTFDENWKTYIQDTVDFIGFNHYTTFYVSQSNKTFPSPSFEKDLGVDVDFNSSLPGSAAFWLKIEPTGFRKKLNWIKSYTKDIPLIVTENGYADKGELQDNWRIYYFREYLRELYRAINEDGINVIGYVAWSLMDNFEWFLGYTARFGVYHVDFNSPNRTRTPKASAEFFKELISTKTIPEADNLTLF